MIGRIIKVDKRGFGFISSEEKPYTRIFFHWSGLKITTAHFTELRIGDKVEFDCIDYKDKGWRAIRIVSLNWKGPKESITEVVTEST